jgi:cell division protein FtsB
LPCVEPVATPAEVAALRATHESAQDTIKVAWQTLGSLRTEIEGLRAEAATLRAERDALFRRVDFLNRRDMKFVEINATLRARVAELEAGNARMREALEHVSKGIDTFHVNPVGGPNICVEGSDRFAHERDVDRLLSIARAALGGTDNGR